MDNKRKIMVRVKDGKAVEYLSTRSGGTWQPIGSGWPAMTFNSEMAEVGVQNQKLLHPNADTRAISE